MKKIRRVDFIKFSWEYNVEPYEVSLKGSKRRRGNLSVNRN